MTSSAESVRWYPRVRIEKYSPAQTAWARRWLDDFLIRNRRPCTPAGQVYHALHGDLLRELFPSGPEDGYAYDEGNSMVNGGLTNLVTLLTGGAVSGSAGRPLTLGGGGGTSGSACVGVGSDGTTAFAATQTHLANLSGEGSANSWYQSMDTGYPTLTSPGTINGQSTFQAANANYPWLEWCWVAGAGVPTAGPVLGSVYATSGSAAMMNRKIPAGGLGAKMTGASWVFACTISFS